MQHRRQWLLSVAAGTMALHHWQAKASTCTPTRLVVGFAPGGGVDALARATALPMSDHLQCQMVVENRPGAGGTLAASQLAQTPHDTNALLFGDTALLIGPHVNPNARYDIHQQFVPIARVARLPLVLAAHASVPVNTPQALIDLLKSAPGQYAYGSAGVATIHHLGGELLRQSTGVDWTHVAYRGGAPAVQDLVGGQIPFAISSLPAVLPHAKSGKVRLIAVLSDTRLPLLPDVPALAEAVPGFDATPSILLLATGKTPPEQRQRLEAAALQALSNPTLQKALDAQGAQPAPLAGSAFQTWMTEEDARWSRVVRQGKIRLD